ncbi:uncharacterized protein LOC114356336 [Ostrinia furnacalis]|uniref:uncharacterized protein LOC114356336 n=1 Tax=Ostrinia furnacalis TaxID=93504 RepID=UPI00103B0C25|nr:uncharacterized protein LOC114356336 [Ostrinia furnacalis]
MLYSCRLAPTMSLCHRVRAVFRVRRESSVSLSRYLLVARRARGVRGEVSTGVPAAPSLDLFDGGQRRRTHACTGARRGACPRGSPLHAWALVMLLGDSGASGAGAAMRDGATCSGHNETALLRAMQRLLSGPHSCFYYDDQCGVSVLKVACGFGCKHSLFRFEDDFYCGRWRLHKHRL